ncbi:MAG: radical SAM family heme chaperone HemW [Clostridiales bacterium]
MKSLGLYIHIPFCKSKCNYCDFNSFTNIEHLSVKYLESIKKEMYNKLDLIENYKIDTIFIGGGTPSILDNSFYYNLFEFLNKNLNIENNNEFSIEVNPGTIDENKIRFYKESGINRISIGLQAWQDKLLKYIGRTHRRSDFLNFINILEKFNFNNINVDLIFGIPYQSLFEWEETLNNVLEFNFKHLSIYSLKIEDDTRFGDMLRKKDLIPLDEDLDRQMYYMAKKLTGKNQYNHYEISNFAHNGFECRHNLKYWNCNEYIGIGAGAHSYIENSRYSNILGINDYIRRNINNEPIIFEKENIDYNEKIKEHIILGLRLIEGINLIDFENKFKINIKDLYYDKIKLLIHKNLIIEDDLYLKLTEKGLDLSNQVFIEFI